MSFPTFPSQARTGDSMRIALDAMGGDRAPGINLDGAAAALASDPDLRLVLVGDEDVVGPLASDAGLPDGRWRIEPSEGCVEMGEKPVVALREKPNASIAVCWKLLAGRDVDAVVSAGNTGAVVAAGLRTRLYLKGIKRPGIAVALPTARGEVILMDAGANPNCRAEHLHQYARVGALYARTTLGVERPRVGLINIGGEIGKGNELVNETHALLTEFPLEDVDAEYVGNVEGRELFEGAADVVVCDGFVGNVLLKAAEGLAGLILSRVGGGLLGQLNVPPDEAQTAFQKFAASYKYSETGGAPLLGVDGLCMIAHGSSDGRAIHGAIRAAGRLAKADLNAQIVDALAS